MTQALALFYRQLAIPLGAGGAIIETVSASALRGDTLNRALAAHPCPLPGQPTYSGKTALGIAATLSLGLCVATILTGLCTL